MSILTQSQTYIGFSNPTSPHPFVKRQFPKFQDLKQKISPNDNQILKNIKQGYFTPNNPKIKFMCKYHKIIKATHYLQTSDGSRQYFCQNCSASKIQNGFTVNKIHYNKNLLELKNYNNFRFNKKEFLTHKRQKTQIQKTDGIIKQNYEQFSKLDQSINTEISFVDLIGKRLLKQLNDKFNDIIKFLNCQRQNCVKLIFQKLDSLKEPLQNLKRGVNDERWALDKAQSKLNLLNLPNHQALSQLLTQTIKPFRQKLDKLGEKRSQLQKMFKQTKQKNRTFSFEQLGSVQSIVWTIYNSFFLSSSQSNPTEGSGKRHFKNSVPLAQVSQFFSSIKKEQQFSFRSHRSLFQQIQTLQDTMKIGQQVQGSVHERLMEKKLDYQRKEAFKVDGFSKKRLSVTTNFSSVTNLRC